MNQIVLIDQVKCATDITGNLQKQFQRNDGAKGYLKKVQERVGREELKKRDNTFKLFYYGGSKK